MANKKVVLVTGVAHYWGNRLATHLLSQSKYRVIGLDSQPPKEMIKGLDFIQADIRDSLLTELFSSESVDTLAHLSLIESSDLSEFAFDFNVLGTIKVFGAAAEAGVRKIILRSTTAVYGAQPSNSAFLDENHALRGSQQTGYIRDLVEIETFCNSFRQQAPQVLLTILRFPNIVGPTVDSAMTRFLKAPVSPVLLGFAPAMQFIHENDAFAALLHVINQDLPGVFNVASEDVVPLDKLLAITGRFPLPVFHRLAYWSNSLFRSAWSTRLMPIELDFIRYPWVADLHRMREELGFIPKYSADETLKEFGGYLRTQPYLSGPASHFIDEGRLRHTLDRLDRRWLHPDAVMREPEDEDEENGYDK